MKSDPFSKICRLCLATGSKLMSIYSKKKKSVHAPWNETIALLLPTLEINQKDGLPRKICKSCANTLESINDFRQRCVDNDQKLRQLIKQTNTLIKEVMVPSTEEPMEADVEPSLIDDEEDPNDEVMVIDPKMEYYSSDDGDDENDQENSYQYEQDSGSQSYHQEHDLSQDVQFEDEQEEADEDDSGHQGEISDENCSNEEEEAEDQPLPYQTNNEAPNGSPLKIEHGNEANNPSPDLGTVKVCNSDQTTPTEETDPPFEWNHITPTTDIQPIPQSFNEDARDEPGLIQIPNLEESQLRLIGIPQYPESAESRLIEIPQFNLQEQGLELNRLQNDKIVSFQIVKQVNNPLDSLPLPTVEYKESNDLDLSQLSAPTTHDDVDDRAMEEIIVQVLGDPDNHSIDLGTDPADFLDEFSDLRTEDSIAPLEVFICKYCDAAFPKQMECQTHELKAHDPLNPYNCTKCSNGYKTNDRDQFINHIKEVHKLKKPFICFHCSKKFQKRTGLRKHTVTHAGLKAFVCAICDKNFSRRNNLRHHLKIHTGERFGCSQCTKTFSTIHALQEHEEYHRNADKFKCSLCGLVLTRKRRLLEHEQLCLKKNSQNLVADLDPENVMVISLDPNMTETDDLPYLGSLDMGESDQLDMENTLFTCNVCFKGFACKRVLKHHKMTHSGVKNFVCTYCDKAFLRRNELDRHVLSVHQQIKEHQCKICEKSFSRKDKLLRHERIHTKTS